MSEIERLAGVLGRREGRSVELIQGVCAGAGTAANTVKVKLRGSTVVVDNVATLASVATNNVVWCLAQGTDLLVIGKQLNAS